MRRMLTAAALMGLVSVPAWAQMTPGMYQITATTTAPGMPQPQSETNNSCMTPQDAKDPVAGLVAPPGAACSFTNKTQSASHFTSDYSCEAEGQKMTGHVDFAMTPVTLNGTITVTVTGPQGPQTVTTTLVTKRTGDCPAQ